ncbi:hypothetical protein ECZU34_43480 [Escherichia coli]|nr:hypothetical protein ECZU34_43480 [Escherichia coli]
MGAFTGKTVLILGGSRGIGAAIVRRFVTDGANVRFTYAGSKDAAEHLAQETGATAVFTDSTDRDAVIDVVRKSGALDILVVNAGIGVFGDALELNADDIDRLFKINIHAPYHASVEAARQMPEGGRILIIGSVNGDRMPVAGMAAYAASKSALQGMARGWPVISDRVGSPLTSSSQGQLIPTLIPPTGQCAICCIVLWLSKDMGNRKRSLVWSHG